MPRFNSPVAAKGVTKNLAGGEAFDEGPEERLVTILLTSFVKDKFYRTADEELSEMASILDALPDKKFAAQAAIYARTVFGMRSITHALAGMLPRHISGSDFAKRFYERIVYRPDDMLEIFAFYLAQNGKRTWPMAMKVGFKRKLESLGPYGLAKYRAEGKSISMVDIVNMVHPTANDTLTKLMKGELKNTDTWEAKLTSAGQADTEEEKLEAKKESWVELVRTKKIGHFALLRNLRNISQQAPEVLDEALELLLDEERLKGSLVMPFRYYSAYQEIRSEPYSAKILDALSKAADMSLSSIPQFEGHTLVVLDVSGSMGQMYGGGPGQKQIPPIVNGAMFAGAMLKSNNTDFMTFSSQPKMQNFVPSTPLFEIVNSVTNGDRGGTDLGGVFRLLATLKEKYDRIILLSDMQSWMSSTSDAIKAYTKIHGRPVVYSWDLQGYGTSQFPEKDTYLLSGFNDKVFDTMKLLETDRKALVNTIKEVVI